RESGLAVAVTRSGPGVGAQNMARRAEAQPARAGSVLWGPGSDADLRLPESARSPLSARSADLDVYVPADSGGRGAILYVGLAEPNRPTVPVRFADLRRPPEA